MTVSEKITDHPGFEPGTLALLVPRSTNWANVSDGEERLMFISIGLQFLPRDGKWITYNWMVSDFFADCHLCCVVE